MQYTTCIPNPLKTLVAASDGTAITGLWFEGQKHFGRTLGTTHEQHDDLPVFDELRAWLATYFEGRDPGPVPPCKPEGTAFQRAVWQQLEKIPYGTLTTYSELGHRAARETGESAWNARAVGSAVGRNPICILLPCHRVVGSNGSLTGYAGGIDTKAALLELEGAIDTKRDIR
ncbi:MAG: methylated-DNA--[protein]-cysteine S-methyltransferase [Eggerthellaceae bacterium]|jgi:methylated-DNA-[protein]-cysteine S-methyltransferase